MSKGEDKEYFQSLGAPDSHPNDLKFFFCTADVHLESEDTLEDEGCVITWSWKGDGLCEKCAHDYFGSTIPLPSPRQKIG